ncbi:PilZ domain-containing protein [Marinobacter sp. 1Y8]
MPERRRRERLPLIQMDARIKVKKNLFSSSWEEITVCDFSRLGLAVVGEHDFKEGETVRLSFRLSTEVGEITVEQTDAIVRNSRVADEGTIFGMEFVENQKASVTESLGRIESVLSRFRKVTDRIRERTV